MFLSLRWWVAVSAAAFFVVGPSARAQEVEYPTVRRVKKLKDGAVYEMTAAWPRSLRAALDSAQSQRLTPALAHTLTGGVPATSAHLWLPSRRAPSVRIVRADYDDVRIPADSLPEQLRRPPAEVRGIGIERRRPAASLVVRVLHYDAGAQRLRRYRRLRVRVTYDDRSGPQAKRAQSASASMTNPHLSVQRSALADGLIFKFPVSQPGIYRITRSDVADLLEGTNRSIDEVDPRRLQVLGNSGAPLPALAGASRPAGLIENPVQVRGGDDGSFDDDDALVFYAHGPQGWRYNESKRRWTHYVNSFANNNYYFLKIGGEKGRRLKTASATGAASGSPLRRVTGRHVVEYDEMNWTPSTYGSGRLWLSSSFTGSLQLLDAVSLPGRVEGTIHYRARFAMQSKGRSDLVFEADGKALGEASAPGRYSTNTVANTAETFFEQQATAATPLNLSAVIDAAPGKSPEAAMDWLRVFYPKRLQAQGGRLRWATPPERSGALAFQLSGFEEKPQVWDVTRPGAVRRLAVEKDGNAYRVAVNVGAQEDPRELIAFTPQALRQAPLEASTRVEHQNLHGLKKHPDLVIVVPEIFREQADQLAERRRKDGLTVVVAERDKIRNEFSGGQPDMRTARDFFKFLYDRAPQDQLLRYALFFGDGTYDFRGLDDRKGALKNYLFPYETKTSLEEDETFTSDDYFGLLDDEEGRWPYRSYTHESSERVDIGIGRLPVQTKEDAKAVLKKIRQYEEIRVDTPWRLRYTFVADDGPTGAAGNENNRGLHVKNIQAAAEAVRKAAPLMNQHKLYGPSYERQFLSGWRIPGLHRDVQEAFREGTAVFNYSGHGGPDVLAQERILTTKDARQLFHPDRPALMITATCSFGRWDMAIQQSGAEALLLNPDGGAAALFTTVRTVYTSDSGTTLNAGLNRKVNHYLFTRTDDGKPRRLGDAMRLTKNTEVGLEGNSRKFNLLGDPSMRIALPRYRARLETVKGDSLAGDTSRVELGALEKVRVTGSVRKAGGELASGFSGQAHFTVYDKKRRVNLPFDPDYYMVREDKIWQGKATAQNGRFDVTFRVPKDISYSNKAGRISVYATGNAVDAGGYSEQVTIGGSARNPQNDRTGPRIQLFINDSTFVPGSTVPASGKLVAKLHDPTGLNAAGAGVGHEMLLTIDDDENHAVDLSSYFQSRPDSYQKGRVEYALEKYPGPLDAGPHDLTVTAWDVANNSQTAQLDFTLTDAARGELRLGNVYNVPNPTTASAAGEPTRFIVEHNQPTGTQADVRLRIYTLNGRPVRTLENMDLESGGVLYAGPLQIRWNGRDEDGDPLAPGIYLYKVRVAVEDPAGGRQVAERIEKLAIVP